MNQCNTNKQNLEKKIENVDKKIPDTSDLVTTIVLNTKNSGLVNRTNYNSKVIKIETKVNAHDHAKYITT